MITSKPQMSCGVQVGTIDSLLIQLFRRNDLTLLTTDQGFHAATKHVEVESNGWFWGAVAGLVRQWEA